jgi:hypothetical protein
VIEREANDPTLPHNVSPLTGLATPTD